MKRWLAGVYDLNGGTAGERLARALAPHDAHTIASEPLHVAYSGGASSSSGPLCLLDGYIDNADELWARLSSPSSGSPEQLLAEGYRRWGAGLPERLRGDFHLLIWDERQRRGLIARDQLGVRSIYLHSRGGRLSFAGEIAHLLELLPYAAAPDSIGIAHWIAISARPGTGTLYEDIRRLDPGSMLLLEPEGVREVRYWRPRFVEPLELATPDLRWRVRTAVEAAVDRRLDPDGVTGVLMSGGLDSSSVAAVAATKSESGRVSAYSAEFPEHPSVDESTLIAELRGRLGLDGMTAEVRPGGLLAGALAWIDAWKLPLTSWGEFWAGPLLRSAAVDGVRVMLGGDGGDELFDCRAYLMADLLREGRLRELVGLAHRLPGFGHSPPRRAVARAAWRYGVIGALPASVQRLAERAGRGPRLPRWLLPSAVAAISERADPLAWKRLEGPRWWAYDAHVLTRGVEELGLFENHRRRAALAGLESRHPLFDLDLLELGLRQPPKETFDPFLDRPVLRASMAGLLPDNVRARPVKALFDSLLVDSLTGPDANAVRQLLSGPGARLAAYVDMPRMNRALLDRTPRQAQDGFRWMYQVWRLATAECWLRYQEHGDVERLASVLGSSSANVTLRPARARTRTASASAGYAQQ